MHSFEQNFDISQNIVICAEKMSRNHLLIISSKAVSACLLVVLALLDLVDSKKIYSMRRQNNNAKIFICKFAD